MTVALVGFDLDETLLDDSGLPAALERVAHRVAAVRPGLAPAEFVAANRRVWQEYWPETEQDWLLGTRPGEEIVAEAWRRTLHGAGHPDEDLVRLAGEAYDHELADAVRLYPDVLPAFDALDAARVPIALLTNGAAHLQRAKLRAVGIEHRFAAIVVSSEEGLAKPDPGVFRILLDRLGATPDESWYVGDNLSKDIAGAAAAGLSTVWLNRRGRQRGIGQAAPTAVVRTLTALPGLLPLS